MADVESRFNRHVVREIARGADFAAVDRVVQEHVVEPCVSAHSTSEGQITAGLVDGALYYLAGIAIWRGTMSEFRVWFASRDPYHCVFRMVRLLCAKGEAMPLEQLRVLDMFLMFP